MAEPGTVPLAAVLPHGDGRLSDDPAGLALITPAQQWSYAAKAEFPLRGIADRAHLVSVVVRVEQGVLGVGWLHKDGAAWIARKSSAPTRGPVELALPIPAGTSGGCLIFHNWADGETRAVIAAIKTAPIETVAPGLGLDLEQAEVAAAAALAARAESGVECRTLRRGDNAEPFRVYTARDGVVFGRPAVIGLRRGRRLTFLRESAASTYQLQSLIDQAVEQVATGAPACVRLESACLLDGYSATNLWHWFMEWAVKVAPLEEAGFAGAYLVPDADPRYARSLELLGVARERIVPNWSDCVFVERLAFTQHTSGNSIYWHFPWLLGGMRERILGNLDALPGPRRLYVARRGRRRVENEEAILPVLEHYGFSVVYMEDHPIDAQIALAAGADIIAGPHGAGLVFAAFMPKGGVLIEMFPADFVDPCLLGVCHALDICYFMLTSRKKPAGTFVNELIEVDLPLLRLTLRNADRLRPL